MNKITIAKLLPTVLLLLNPSLALASLVNGSAINLSGTRNIPISQPVSINIRWSMLRTSAAAQPGTTVTSVQGRFTDATGRLLLGTVPKVLSKTVPIGIGDTTFTFTESLIIPRNILYTAYKNNLREIYYRRDFTDCPGTECSALVPTPFLVFSLSGSMGGPFSLNHLLLRFENGASGAIVGAGQPLRAAARLELSGSGILKGVWEIASSATTAGTPTFSPLLLVTQQVSSLDTVRLLSPPLPTVNSGNYLIRFRLIEPRREEELPTLQYVVTDTVTKNLPKFGLTGPEPGAILNKRTLFQWKPVKKANSYKLELVATAPENSDDPVTPVTGILVKGTDNKIRLTPSLLEKLVPGRSYWWHVVALDKTGQIVSTTEWRMIKASQQ